MQIKLKTIAPITFFLLFTFLFSYQVEAQISIGIKGGYSNAWEYYGDVDLPDDAQIDVDGYYFSLLSYLKLNKHLDIGVEPSFVQRGAACIPGFDPFLGDTEFQLNYIEIPLMLRGNICFLNDKLEAFGKIGYGASMVQKGIGQTTFIGSEDPPIITEIDFSNPLSSLNRFDHGLYGGLGLGVNLGNNQLFLEGNYYNAFRDFDSNNTSKNRSLQLGIGFVRTFNKKG